MPLVNRPLETYTWDKVRMEGDAGNSWSPLHRLCATGYAQPGSEDVIYDDPLGICPYRPKLSTVREGYGVIVLIRRYDLPLNPDAEKGPCELLIKDANGDQHDPPAGIVLPPGW